MLGNLFTYNTTTHEVEIHEDLIYAIPVYKDIMRRRNKIKGDAHGRKKTVNYLELAYIALCEDMDSPYVHLSEKDKRVEISKFLDMPKGWAPDGLIKVGRETYNRYFNDGAASIAPVLRSRRSLSTTGRAVDLINGQLEIVIDKTQEKLDNMIANDQDLLDPSSNNIIEQINMIVSLSDKLHGQIGKIPKSLETLKQAELKFREDMNKKKGKAAGGKEIYSREIPRDERR